MENNQNPTNQTPVNPMPPMQEVPVPTVSNVVVPPVPPSPVTPPPLSVIPVTLTENAPPPGNKPKTVLYVLVAIVVIITLAALGLIFYNFLTAEETAKTANKIPEITIPQPTVSLFTEDSETEKLKTQGTTDEIGDIEKDLKNTDLTNLDKEVGSISSEINQPQ